MKKKEFSWMKTLLLAVVVLYMSFTFIGVVTAGFNVATEPTYAWHTFYGGSGYDYGTNIATDGSGNVYVIGNSEVSWNGPAGQPPLHAHSGGHDIYVLKLDSSGAYQWHTFYRWAAIWESTYGITTDGIGNVYVTAESNATWNGPDGQLPLHAYSGDIDISILKLDSSGAYQWHTFYGGSSRDDPKSIVTDGNGNIYVTGESEATWSGPTGQLPLHAHSGDSYYDLFVLKLDSSGSYQWHTFYGAGGSASNAATEIVPDGRGNLYITGACNGAWSGPAGQTPLHPHTAGILDIFVLKLDSSGSYLWHTFYGSSGDDDEYAFGLTTDGSENVYIVGSSDKSWNGPAGQLPLHAYSGNDDIFVLKLDSSGAYQWHTFYGSSDDDSGYGIAIDGNGNVYVTGDSRASWNGPAGEPPLHPITGGNDMFVLKLDSIGSYQWHAFYGDTYYANIATDGSGSVYVTGTSYNTWSGPTGQLPLHAHSADSISDLYVLKLAAPVAGISLTSPNGGETFTAGTTQTIRWSYTGNPGLYVKVELLKGGVVTRTIAWSTSKGTGGTGSCNWTIPASQTPGTDYRIRVTSRSDGAYTDTSDSDFSIAPPTITVVSPNGGETLIAGTTQTIRWTYAGNPGLFVKVELLKGGVANRTIASVTPKGSGGSGSHNWTIPANQAPGTNYRIRVTSTSNGAYTDTSDSDFSITAPTITVVSPNGGETLTAGSTQTIRWSYTGDPGSYIKIQLLKEGVVNRTIKTVISKGSGGNGSCLWLIPSTQVSASDYQIKITSLRNSSYSDTSDSNFTISK